MQCLPFSCTTEGKKNQRDGNIQERQDKGRTCELSRESLTKQSQKKEITERMRERNAGLGGTRGKSGRRENDAAEKVEKEKRGRTITNNT